MDNKKLEEILREDHSPEVDVNARKRAVNLAMAEFKSAQNEKSKKSNKNKYNFFAVTQRPMFMYHSWDSQNAWLRQITSQNYLYMNREECGRLGIEDESWVWVASHNGKIRAQVKHMDGVETNTVWTWNAIGKMSGAWGLSKQASEATHGFLLNHLISETLPASGTDRALTNSDPITGQAAWYDLKVRITKAGPGETGTWPQFGSPEALS